MAIKTASRHPQRRSPVKLVDTDFGSIEKVSKLWALRMLIKAGGEHKFLTRSGFDSRQLATWLDLEEPNPFDDDHDRSDRIYFDKRVEALKTLHLQAEQNLRYTKIPHALERNIARISHLAGLNDVECRILEFVVILLVSSYLRKAADYVDRIEDPFRFADAMSLILNLPVKAIQASFRSDSALRQTGLITINGNEYTSLDSKFHFLNDDLPMKLLEADIEPIDWLKNMVLKSELGHLKYDDYPQCKNSLAIIVPYLRKAISDGRCGVNILVYGPPGTGKTQLAKLISKELSLELLEVSTEDMSGDSIAGAQRLKALSATNIFFYNQSCLVLFDEIEDAFTKGSNDSDEWFRPKKQRNNRGAKGFINRLLETNKLPTIWISNSLHDIDSAFIRRFDVVLEMPIPPYSQRERIIRKVSAGMLDETTIKRMAKSEVLAPAVISRSVSVVESIASELGGNAEAAKAVELLVNQTLKAQDHLTIPRLSDNDLLDVFDPAFVNASTDLVSLTEQLRHLKRGRICLYGPPGTGKTAYGRWLAEQLQIPLHVKRVSDLTSMWVGETEKQIAEAFTRAEEEGALLLIDEIDSFLQDRQHAQRNWEITQVNEMLTQMESFNGLFVASTNLMNGLDAASLRRFDLKLKFDYLRPDQALQLLKRYASKLDLPAPSNLDQCKLAELDVLTPGDFAVVSRQNRLTPLKSATELVAALELECTLKPGQHGRVIGFI